MCTLNDQLTPQRGKTEAILFSRKNPLGLIVATFFWGTTVGHQFALYYVLDVKRGAVALTRLVKTI